MRGSLPHALVIYGIGMYILLTLKPRPLYREDGKTLKSWTEIEVEDFDTWYNVYVFAIVLAYASYYLSERFV
jgi:hypothetical protein